MDKGYVEIREPGSGKLLMRYDPQRNLAELQRRGRKTVVDLAEIKRESANERRNVATAVR